MSRLYKTAAPRRIRNMPAASPIMRKGGAHHPSRKRDRQSVRQQLRHADL